MRYKIQHTTTYRYSEPVSVCHNQACLLPRNCAQQTVIESEVIISPLPARRDNYVDYFGNRALYFAIQTPHDTLAVTARSTVDTRAGAPPGDSPPWEQVARQLATDTSAAGLLARGFIAESLVSVPDARIADFARASFLHERPLLEAAQDLTARIYQDFTYDPAFTTLATPLSEVLEHRRGVCQDFAHLAIACIRSVGLPARYVSGYLETLPPPGQEKLRGADASHAWIAVYLPDHGWFDFDPTNNQMASEQYVTLAWGRDYNDVTPLKGIVFGGGEHQLEVAVDVERN